MQAEILAIAQAAYTTYRVAMGGKSPQGGVLPEFEQLPQQHQLAWIAASSAAIRTEEDCRRQGQISNGVVNLESP